MTLLSICRDAADEIGITRPSAVVGSSAPEVQKLYRYANRAGKELMKSVVWQVLRAEQTFTALATETQTSILPDDFDRFVPETFWDRTNKALLSGPVTATQWAGLKATGYADTMQRKFAYRGGAVLVLPTFSGGESLAFEYVSANWAAAADDTAKSSFTVDTDTARIDEELITRAVKYLYLDGEGLPAIKAEVDFNIYLNTLIANDQPDAGILLAADIFGGGRHFSGAPPANGQATSI